MEHHSDSSMDDKFLMDLDSDHSDNPSDNESGSKEESFDYMSDSGSGTENFNLHIHTQGEQILRLRGGADVINCAACKDEIDFFGKHYRNNTECLKVLTNSFSIKVTDDEQAITEICLLHNKCPSPNCQQFITAYRYLKTHVKNNEGCKNYLLGQYPGIKLDKIFTKQKNSNKDKRHGDYIKDRDQKHLKHDLEQKMSHKTKSDIYFLTRIGHVFVKCVLCETKHSIGKDHSKTGSTATLTEFPLTHEKQIPQHLKRHCKTNFTEVPNLQLHQRRY